MTWFRPDKQLWPARILIGLVLFFNLQCALVFLIRPELYAPGFELNGAAGLAIAQSRRLYFCCTSSFLFQPTAALFEVAIESTHEQAFPRGCRTTLIPSRLLLQFSVVCVSAVIDPLVRRFPRPLFLCSCERTREGDKATHIDINWTHAQRCDAGENGRAGEWAGGREHQRRSDSSDRAPAAAHDGAADGCKPAARFRESDASQSSCCMQLIRPLAKPCVCWSLSSRPFASGFLAPLPPRPSATRVQSSPVQSSPVHARRCPRPLLTLSAAHSELNSPWRPLTSQAEPDDEAPLQPRPLLRAQPSRCQMTWRRASSRYSTCSWRRQNTHTHTVADGGRGGTTLWSAAEAECRRASLCAVTAATLRSRVSHSFHFVSRVRGVCLSAMLFPLPVAPLVRPART